MGNGILEMMIILKENIKDEYFVELIQYTKQMYNEFKEITGD